jgi:hypothetical protein
MGLRPTNSDEKFGSLSRAEARLQGGSPDPTTSQPTWGQAFTGC